MCPHEHTCRAGVLAAILGCALTAISQVPSIKFAEFAGAPATASGPFRPVKPLDLAGTSALPIAANKAEAPLDLPSVAAASGGAPADAATVTNDTKAAPAAGGAPTNTLTLTSESSSTARSAEDAATDAPDGSDDGQSQNAVQPFTPVPHKRTHADDFQWKAALREYSFGIAIQHAWRFAHEPGTRYATTHGHWFEDWIHSVGETRGWDYSGWHAGYVGHPLNGAYYGFIERQNDPLYRQVEWGDGHIYWMSLLRSMAFSAIASTQWTLGPVGEAGLGNSQLHASPGFMTLVNTPGLGMFVMMGEDLLDRYVIIPVENHTANPWFILIMRSLGNPARSFANLMAFKQGWDRPTRMGIFGENHERRKELVKEYKEGLIPAPFGPHTAEERALMNQTVQTRPPSKEADIELNAYSMYESFLGGGSCMGGGGQGAARVNAAWQVVAEVNGCMIINSMPKYQSGDSVMFAAGPRWTPRATHNFSPYAEVMFGGRRITHDIASQELKNQLLKEWSDGELPYYPRRSAWMVEYQQFGFAMTMGGGVDKAIGRAWAWRILDVQYSHSWVPPVDPINAQRGVQIRTGAVLRIGTW